MHLHVARQDVGGIFDIGKVKTCLRRHDLNQRRFDCVKPALCG
jgi:hypothetical protein